MDKVRVFITKTVINWESDQSTIDNRVDSSIIIDSPRIIVVGKLGQGMRSSKFTIHDLYSGGCQWQWQVCVSDTMVSVCMSRWVCVCVSFHLVSFKLSTGCLFITHHVNQGGVQSGLRLQTDFPPRMLGRVDIFACFTLSHTVFPTLCQLSRYLNSLPVCLGVCSPRVLVSFRVFLRISFPDQVF